MSNQVYMRQFTLVHETLNDVEFRTFQCADARATIERIWVASDAWSFHVLVRDRGELAPVVVPGTDVVSTPGSCAHRLTLVRSRRGETPIPEGAGTFVGEVAAGRGERFFVFHVRPAVPGAESARPAGAPAPSAGASPPPPKTSSPAAAPRGPAGSAPSQSSATSGAAPPSRAPSQPGNTPPASRKDTP